MSNNQTKNFPSFVSQVLEIIYRIFMVGLEDFSF